MSRLQMQKNARLKNVSPSHDRNHGAAVLGTAAILGGAPSGGATAGGSAGGATGGGSASGATAGGSAGGSDAVAAAGASGSVKV